MTQRKSTGLLVSVVLATATFGIGPKVRAAPHCDMEHTRVGLDGVLYCVEYEGGAGVSTPEVPAELISLAEFLDDMEEALADSVAEAGDVPGLDVGEPFYLVAQPQMEASSVVALHHQLGGSAAGVANIKAYPNSGNVALNLELTDGEVTRILDQVLSLTDGVLTSWGTLMIDDGSGQITTLTGGWTYSPAEGAVVVPNSDPGFINALAAMLLVPDVGGRGYSLGTIVTFIGNVVRMGVNYVLDLFVPYTPPTFCVGPSIYDGGGQSCEGVDVACKDNLADACMLLDDIPGVWSHFKQCMKGRCGCGGSSFSRARISCDLEGKCHACPAAAYGCSLVGSGIFYCKELDDPCDCISVVFHEMSHGCGARDDTLESYRIGDWFAEEFDERFPDVCAPPALGE